MNYKHLQRAEIESYMSGTLDDIENERIIRHLGECEICLEEVEKLWKGIAGIGNIENERIKGRILQKIYRTNFIGHFIKLGLKGFQYMVLGLLFPFKHSKQVISQKKESKHE